MLDIKVIKNDSVDLSPIIKSTPIRAYLSPIPFHQRLQKWPKEEKVRDIIVIRTLCLVNFSNFFENLEHDIP